MRKPLTVIGIVGVTIIVAVIVTSNRGSLAYFSPHTLEFRTQSERTFFGTGIPFYRSNHKPVDNPLIAMLIDDGFVSPQFGTTRQWQTVFHWNDSWRDGYGPLYDVFVRHRDQIIEWSRSYRECAEIYWSEGFLLLRSDNPADVMAGEVILNYCWKIKSPEEMRKTIQKIKDNVASEWTR